jgi:hypothetical protein
MKDTSTARCQRHPEAAAGWSCDACQASLCPDCVAVRRAMSTEYLACGLCNERAQPILVHRSRLPLAARLRGFWRYPFSPTGLMVLGGASALMMVCRWLAVETFLLVKFIPTVIGLGIFWGLFFSVIRTTARGEREMDTPDFSDSYADCVVPALRGFVGTSLLWLPGLLYLLYGKQWDVRKPLDTLLETPAFYVTGGLPQLDFSQVVGDPVLWLIILAGGTYVPMVLLLSAAGSSAVKVLNPLAVIGAARRLGRDYTLTVGVLAGLGVALVLMHGVAAAVRWMQVPVLSLLLSEFLTTLVPVLMAHVLGLLLYVRGDSLGYGLAADYLEPVLGKAQPRSELLPLRQVLPAVGSGAPEEAAGTMAETISALTQALEAQDVKRALSLYPELREPRFAKQVAPAHHLLVGQAAVAQGQYELAVKALESAADVAPDSPEASRALVLLARVYGERLREPERAASIYRYVVHRYPDTDASRFALARLPPTS